MMCACARSELPALNGLVVSYVILLILLCAYVNRRFRSLIPSYIRDSSVAVVAYDITSTSPKRLSDRAG